MFGFRIYLASLSLVQFCVDVLPSFWHPLFNEPSDKVESVIQQFSSCVDGFLDIVRVVGWLFGDVFAMGFDFVTNARIVHGSSVVSQYCSVGKDFLEVVDEGGVDRETDGTEPVLEVREKVWNGLFIGNFDEDNLLSEGVVKGVHVDEVDGGSVVVVDFGDFEVTWVRDGVPEVKSDFLLSM